MDKVYSEDEVKKLIKMSHILGTVEDAFNVKERHEIIMRDRHLYSGGEYISEMVINYSDKYLSWSPEYLVWYKDTFKSFPHTKRHSINHIDDVLAMQKEFKSINEIKVVTFEEYKANRLKLQRISEEINKQRIKVE